MPIHRRDFMKVLGISVASLFLSRCRSPFAPVTTCYMPLPPSGTLPVATTTSSARERLRLYWLRFAELAQRSREHTEEGFGEELASGHRTALSELVVNGEIHAETAGLVQEAYQAAVDHIRAANSGVTCYEMAWVDYAPDSANVLVEQASILNQLAEQGTIDPVVLAKAQAALEHDLAFYALTDEEVEALYSQIREQTEAQEGTSEYPPPFEELSLELTPDVKEATQFIIELLTGK